MRAHDSHARPIYGRSVAVLRVLVLLASVYFVVLYLVLACLRVQYPFELEWLEGAAVDHVRTILAGEPLYAEPSLRFTPLTYTPAYFYLAAALSPLTGEGFLSLRLISIAASLGVLILLYRLASRETQSMDAGLLAAGLFAGTYGWTDGWFDIARNDALMLLLALSAVYVLRWYCSTAGAALAGILISLCFLVKQTGFIIAIPLLVYCLFHGWRSFLSYAATVAITVVGTTLLLDRLFDGWYTYYIVDVPGQHPLAFTVLWTFWRYDLLKPLPLALAAAPLFVIWCLRRDLHQGMFYLSVTAALFAGALASRLHSLSYINVVLPAYAALAIVASIALHQALRVVAENPEHRTRRWAPAVLYTVALLQLIRLGYAPASLVPGVDDLAAGRQLLERLAAMPGDVFAPYHGYLPVLAGKAPHAHAVVIADVIRGGMTDVEKGFAQKLADALSNHQFDSIILPETPTPVRRWLPVDEHYGPAERVVTLHTRFWRPELRYVPR